MNEFSCIVRVVARITFTFSSTGLEIVTDRVANVTNIFSLATKNSGLVATLATRFLSYDSISLVGRRFFNFEPCSTCFPSPVQKPQQSDDIPFLFLNNTNGTKQNYELIYP